MLQLNGYITVISFNTANGKRRRPGVDDYTSTLCCIPTHSQS